MQFGKGKADGYSITIWKMFLNRSRRIDKSAGNVRDFSSL
ncbi:Uncharacterized protein dnm_067730 [Desulfonema magnum]|uniref:Uncharacterized protein n=1 Tax=Desulfonema magnum TaxID=45655 RepID=A0A975BS46_9BACT|nr:Uncharacterized protein dnm_067730 [Desulfonema magnum]